MGFKPTKQSASDAKRSQDMKRDDQTRPKASVKPPPTGEVALHRIPIVDFEGNTRGHVGHRATQATVARFLGRHGAELKQQDGRLTWVGDKPPPPPPPPPLPGMPPLEAERGEAEIGLIRARTEALGAKREPSPDRAGARGSAKPKSKVRK